MSTAQTPGMWVKAGDSPFFFSPECVQALLDAGFNPDNFGTYSHVKEKATMARARCAAWDDARPSERRNMPEPTAEDRYLAASTSGHMTQNAVNQRPPRPGGPVPPRAAEIRDGAVQVPGGNGVQRGNACHNEIDGYSSYGAPSAPMEGAANDPNTENGAWGQAEGEQAAQVQRVAAAREQYDPTWRREHEDQRLRDYVQRHPDRMDEYRQAAANQGEGGPDSARRRQDMERPPETRGKNDVREEQRVTHGSGKSDRAEKCLKAWREKMEQAMRDDCVANRGRNAAIAATPGFPNDPQSQQAQQRTVRAREAELAAQQRLEASQGEVDRRRRAGQPVPPPDMSQAHDDQARAHLAAEQATREYHERLGAGCAVAQADRISAGRPRMGGRSDF